MTTAAAFIPLTVDGVDVQEAGLDIFLEIIGGVPKQDPPSVRGKDLIVPARQGRIPYNRVNDMLRLLLSGWVRGSGADEDAIRASFRSNTAIIRNLFAFDSMPVELVALLEDGDTATINARPLNIIWGNEVPSAFTTVTIEMESVDPDWVIELAGS